MQLRYYGAHPRVVCVRSRLRLGRRHNIATPYVLRTHRMRTTVIRSAGLRRAALRCSRSRSCTRRCRDARSVGRRRARRADRGRCRVRDAAHGVARCGRSRARIPRRAPTAIMDQQQHAVRAARARRAVRALRSTFPNSDNVSHHVYSFSRDEDVRAGALQGRRVSAGRVRSARHRRRGLQHSRRHARLHRRRRHAALRADERAGVALIDGVPDGEYTSRRGRRACGANALPAAEQLAVATGTAAAENPQSRAAWRRAHPHGGRA